MIYTGNEDPRAKEKRNAEMILGLAFILPAALTCFFVQGLPAIKTFFLSFTSFSGFGPSRFVGMSNYANAFGSGGIASSLGLSFIQGLVRVLACVLPALLIGWGTAGLSRGPRMLMRSVSTIPIALYMPALSGLAWSVALSPARGILGQAGFFGNPGKAYALAIAMDGISWLGLSIGFGVSLAMGAVAGAREENGAKRVWPAFLTLALLMSLAAVALAPQEIDAQLAFPLASLNPKAMSPAYAIYRSGFMMMRFGTAAALSVILILGAGICGLAGCCVLVLGRVRLSLKRERGRAPLGSPRSLPLAVIAAILCAAAVLASILPIALSGGSAAGSMSLPRFLRAVSFAPSLLNALIPAFLTVAFFQLPFSYLAALSIGALRPLGKRSDLILFLFAPFLFISLAPLSVQHYLDARNLGALGGFLYRMVPQLSSVPMVFVLAIFFKGQRADYESGDKKGYSAFAKSFILPSLPLAGLLTVLSLGYLCRETFSAMLFSNSPKYFTLMLNTLKLNGSFSATNIAAGIFFLAWLGGLAAMIALLPFQLSYIDKLELRTGKDGGAEA
jgi:ABC-type sugar transport system permease subunit